MILTIIPARSGSKRLPGKNKKLLAGKPLILWTLDAAQNARIAQHIVVSTDDPDITKIAEKAGIDVIQRPSEISGDNTSKMDVITHAISQFDAKDYESILYLQPTSPLRTSEDIENAVKLMEEKNADSVISVNKANAIAHWTNTLPEDLRMSNFISPDLEQKQSHQLPVHYSLNGAIFLSLTPVLLEKDTFFGPNSFAYIMDESQSIDIDTDIDFSLAEIVNQN